jgi:hypothetical protein
MAEPDMRFNAQQYKTTTRVQWEAAAPAWDRWDPTLTSWLGAATDQMLDLAGVNTGAAVVDVAAGAVQPRRTWLAGRGLDYRGVH